MTSGNFFINIESKLVYIIAGIAIGLGYATLERKRSNIKCIQDSHRGQIDIGLLKLNIPLDYRGTIKNDVLSEEAIKQVKIRLYIYIESSKFSKAEETNYISTLFNELWEIACHQNKTELDIRIIPSHSDEGYISWDQIILLEEINAVLAEDSTMDITSLNKTRLCQNLSCVTYYPLHSYIQQRLNPQLTYFEDTTAKFPRFSKVIMGGTFDQLHNGHKKLLFLASKICKHTLVIGMTADEILRSKSHAYLIQSIEERKQVVRDYLSFLKPDLQVELPTIHDPFGPAITLEDCEAIMVSTETIKGAMKINEIRKERNLRKLRIFVCRRTEPATLSSSYIRSLKAKSQSLW